MKPKEVVQLVVSLAVLAFAGFLIYGQLAPQKATTKGVKVEKIMPVPAGYDGQALSRMTDGTVRDFYVRPDLRDGIGNASPFGPLR